MKVYRLTVMVVDTDELGEDGIREQIRASRYPNDCMTLEVLAVEGVEVEWSDDHPLNRPETDAAAWLDAALNAPGKNCGRCHTCLDGVLFIGMILCPDCGNKRCPRASNHTLACTGSNEPGQPGSVYGGVE